MIGFNLLQDLKKPENKDKQAELIAAAIIQIEEKSLSVNVKEIATKADLKDLELRTRADLKDLEIRLIQKYNLNSIIVATVTVVSVLLGLLIKFSGN
jgi:hypothetical protein